jgi:hypothetical protein
VLPGIASNGDDPAAVFHVTDGCLHTDKRGAHVDGDHAVEVIETVGVDCAPGEDAGIAGKDIEWAEGLLFLSPRSEVLRPRRRWLLEQALHLPRIRFRVQVRRPFLLNLSK